MSIFLNRQVNRLVGKAIHRYGLLGDGDRILMAVSGGADSLLALWFLDRWRAKAPIHFDVLPVYLDMGFEGGATPVLTRYFRQQGYSFHVEETDYGTLAHSPFNRGKSPCFLCSMWRRKRLFELADRYGCNKVAMGHNQDDMIETFFLNMFYSGEMSTMMPRQEMFRGLLTIIRPMILVSKERIRKLAERLELPVVDNPCPSSGSSRRQSVREFLDTFYRTNRAVRGNLMHALSSIRPEYLPLSQRLPSPGPGTPPRSR